MKLIRKYDVFKELTRYADGDLSLGECIDNCPTLDLTKYITELERIQDMINKQTWRYGLLDLSESVTTLVTELKEWEREND